MHTAICAMASDLANSEAVAKLAEALGVQTLGGYPIMEFIERAKAAHFDELVRDFADVNPTLAAKILKMADILQDEADEKNFRDRNCG